VVPAKSFPVMCMLLEFIGGDVEEMGVWNVVLDERWLWQNERRDYEIRSWRFANEEKSRW
jgi:hypothetical protein